MKYGELSHGVVNINQPRTIKLSDGENNTAPAVPKSGDIRYNHEREATGLGGNSGLGQYEIYRDGAWTTLLTEMDMSSDLDVKNKVTMSDNVIFKMIADSLKDTFISAIGSISMVQENENTIAALGPEDPTRWPGKKFTYSDNDAQGDIEINNGTRVLPNYLDDVQHSSSGSQRIAGKLNRGASWAPPIVTKPLRMRVDDSSGNNLVGVFRGYIGSGRLFGVAVDDMGEGYDPQNPPQLMLDTRGGSGAIITAEVVAGILTQINVIDGGSGYRPAHLVVVEKNARARLYAKYNITTMDDGTGAGTHTITSIQVVDGGAGYETIPEVFISDGGHSAVVEPIMGSGNSRDKIIKTVVKSSGFDYSVTPDVVIKSLKPPTKEAKLRSVIGDNRLLAIKLMKPIPSNFLENGNVPLIITGGNPATNAVAHMKVVQGVGAEVIVTDPGSGYQSAPSIKLPNSFVPPSTGMSVFAGGVANHRLQFKFDIFEACGVEQGKKSMYDISLLNNLSGTYPLLSPYSGQAVRMLARFNPEWAPFTNFNHPNYGKYSVDIELFGQRYYYSSALTSSWLAQVTKARSD